MHQALQLDVALVGLSTKIHAVVDALGNPVSFHLTPGQACDLYRQGGRGHSSRGSKPFLPAVERSGTGVSSPVLEGRLGLGGVQAPSNPPPCSPLPAKSASGSDLDGADVLLPDLRTDILLADKGYDADARVIDVLEAQAKTAVIPSKRNRTTPRNYDKDLYKARHGN
jgi:transposase